MIYVLIALIVAGIYIYGKNLFLTLSIFLNSFTHKISYLILLSLFGILLVLTRSFLLSFFICATLAGFNILFWMRGFQFDGKGSRHNDIKKMSRKEACEILEVSENANAHEIQSAHKEFLKKLHPDLGGSNYLTRLINEAKDTLLSD